MLAKVAHESVSVRETFLGIADRVYLQRHASQIESLPEPREHNDLLDVHIRPGKPECLDVELMELTIAALLRSLVAEHGARGPQALRPVIGEVVLYRGAHDSRCRFRAEREAFSVIVEGVHLPLDDVGRATDATDEERRGFDDRQTHVAIPVLREGLARGVLDAFPDRGLVGQHIVHAANGLDRRSSHRYTAALTAIDFLSGLRCAAGGSPP